MKIGLDIDGVICNFLKGFYNWYNMKPEKVKTWSTKFIDDNLPSLFENEDFWLSLPTCEIPENINFGVYCYVTARANPVSFTEKWIELNGFPKAKVYSIGKKNETHTNKTEIIKSLDLDLFVDDKYQNFVEINNDTKCKCLLKSCSYNRKLKDYRLRIDNLSQVSNYL